MNNYFQSFIDRFPKTMSKEELTRTFNMCCDGLVKGNNKIVGGCNKAAICDQAKCPVYKEYQIWLNIIDDIRKPKTVVLEVPKKKRDYHISPEKKMVRDIKKELKILSDYVSGSEDAVAKITEHLDKGHLKWAYKAAVKNKLYKIADTIGSFINSESDAQIGNN